MTTGYIAQGLWSATKTTCGAAVSTVFVAVGSAFLNHELSKNTKLLSLPKKEADRTILVLGSVAVVAFASLLGKELGKAAIRDGMKWTFVKPTGVKVAELLFVIGAVAIGCLLSDGNKAPHPSGSSRQQDRPVQSPNRHDYDVSNATEPLTPVEDGVQNDVN